MHIAAELDKHAQIQTDETIGEPSHLRVATADKYENSFILCNNNYPSEIDI